MLETCKIVSDVLKHANVLLATCYKHTSNVLKHARNILALLQYACNEFEHAKNMHAISLSIC